MKISALGEFGLIERIRKSSPQKSPSVLTGIGDDAAALRVAPSAALLATTDMLIEKVHFDLAYTDFYSLGWKSAAVNLSDIAAMGGLPRFCLTSLAIPSRITAEQILDFYSGFNGLLRTHRTVLAGGDTCASPDALVVSVTALGEAHRRMILTRAGAKPGDHIFVTGTLGDSAAGLELLRMRSAERGVRKGRFAFQRPEPSRQGRRGKGFSSALHTPNSELVGRHLRPVPRVEWGRKIALSGCASALIDVSDGLSSDLGHVCEQSGLGAVVYSARIPLSAALRKSAGQLKKPPLHYALSGGEDYELLLTAPPAKVKRLRSLGVPMTEIGEIIRGRQLIVIDERGKKRPLRPTGYNHFGRFP